MNAPTVLRIHPADNVVIARRQLVGGTMLTSIAAASSKAPQSVDACGERIFQLMLDTASGRKTRSELHGYGQNEFVPCQLGAVM